MITQRRLLHLQALAEHAHFGRAAKALDISQPALTKSIQALEAELGVPLVDRNSGSVTLTAFGEVVIERSRLLLTAEEDLRREIGLLASHEIGSLRVALGPYPSVTSGYAGISRVLARHPRIKVTAHVAGWRDVTQQVLARTVDLGIAEVSDVQEDERLATELLGQHRGYFFCRPGHPILEHPQASPAQLLHYPWVAPRIPPRLAGALPQPLGAAGSIDPGTGDFVPAIEIDVPMQIARFLTDSNALALSLPTIMERELLAGEVVIVPLAGLGLQSGYGFIYLKSRSLSPAAQRYMQEVREEEVQIRAREAALASHLGLQQP